MGLFIDNERPGSFNAAALNLKFELISHEIGAITTLL